MKKLLVTLLVPSILSSSAVFAKDGYHVSLFGGVDSPSRVKSVNVFASNEDRDLETSPMGGTSYGYNYKGVDLSISYENHTSKFKDGSETEKSITNIGLINLAYYLNHAEKVRPYIGVGAGVGNIRLKSDFNSDGNPFYVESDIVFAYQGRAGVMIDVSKRFSIFADARMTTIMDKTLKNDSAAEVGTNYTSATVGITYHLGGHGSY